MAEIIQLEQFRHSLRAPSGVAFPTVYRVTGCYWKDPGAALNLEDLKPDPTRPHREYSLSSDPSERLANLVCEPIMRLDPVHDCGWVIVRHHRNRDIAEAYFDGLDDGAQNIKLGQRLWQTADGIFSLHHREARYPCRDCLLIYSLSAQYNVDWPLVDPWCHVVASDGSIFSDPDILLPDDL